MWGSYLAHMHKYILLKRRFGHYWTVWHRSVSFERLCMQDILQPPLSITSSMPDWGALPHRTLLLTCYTIDKSGFFTCFWQHWVIFSIHVASVAFSTCVDIGHVKAYSALPLSTIVTITCKSKLIRFALNHFHWKMLRLFWLVVLNFTQCAETDT